LWELFRLRGRVTRTEWCGAAHPDGPSGGENLPARAAAVRHVTCPSHPVVGPRVSGPGPRRTAGSCPRRSERTSSRPSAELPPGLVHQGLAASTDPDTVAVVTVNHTALRSHDLRQARPTTPKDRTALWKLVDVNWGLRSTIPRSACGRQTIR